MVIRAALNEVLPFAACYVIEVFDPAEEISETYKIELLLSIGVKLVPDTIFRMVAVVASALVVIH